MALKQESVVGIVNRIGARSTVTSLAGCRVIVCVVITHVRPDVGHGGAAGVAEFRADGRGGRTIRRRRKYVRIDDQVIGCNRFDGQSAAKGGFRKWRTRIQIDADEIRSPVLFYALTWELYVDGRGRAFGRNGDGTADQRCVRIRNGSSLRREWKRAPYPKSRAEIPFLLPPPGATLAACASPGLPGIPTIMATNSIDRRTTMNRRCISSSNETVKKDE